MEVHPRMCLVPNICTACAESSWRKIWWWIRVNIIWGEKAPFIPHQTFVKKGVRNWKDQNSKWCIGTQNNMIYAQLLFPTLPWHLLHLHWTLESSLWAGEGIGEKRSSWSVYQLSLTEFEFFKPSMKKKPSIKIILVKTSVSKK